MSASDDGWDLPAASPKLARVEPSADAEEDLLVGPWRRALAKLEPNACTPPRLEARPTIEQAFDEEACLASPWREALARLGPTRAARRAGTGQATVSDFLSDVGAWE